MWLEMRELTPLAGGKTEDLIAYNGGSKYKEIV
jgi:hypothetical protein